MKFYLAVTDNNWYHYLSQIQPDEINFWQLCVRMTRRRGDMDVISRVQAAKPGLKPSTPARHFYSNSTAHTITSSAAVSSSVIPSSRSLWLGTPSVKRTARPIIRRLEPPFKNTVPKRAGMRSTPSSAALSYPNRFSYRKKTGSMSPVFGPRTSPKEKPSTPKMNSEETFGTR